MVGCCKFGPCRKKRKYEVNNPPYTENKDNGVYHSQKQKLTETSTRNGAAVAGAVARTNPAFENGSSDHLGGYNGAAVVDLDSECNSLSDAGEVTAGRKGSHKANAEGFKGTDLVVTSTEKKKRKGTKGSKRSSKSSSSSSSSSSSNGSKRSSKHSDDVKFDEHYETANTENVVVVVANVAVNVDDINTEIQREEANESDHEHVEEIVGGAVAYSDEHNEEVKEAEEEVGDSSSLHEEVKDADEENKVEEITIRTSEMTIETQEEMVHGFIVSEVTQDDEVVEERRDSNASHHSSKSSSSSEAKSYQITGDEPNEDAIEVQEDEIVDDNEDVKEEEEDGERRGSSSSKSSGVIEAPPGIEEVDYDMSESVQELRNDSYTITEVTEEISESAEDAEVEEVEEEPPESEDL